MQNRFLLLCFLPVLLGSALVVRAQSAAFTYKGHLLEGGQPADGSYDVQFRLADAATDGNYVGVAVTNAPVAVSNGLFSVTLDFGSEVFDGSPRWLEVSVRTNGSVEPYTALLPRQAVAATPYAVFAGKAGTALSVDGANILPGTITSRQMEPATWRQVTNNSYAGAFAGNGAGLTNLSGGNIAAQSVASNQVQVSSIGLSHLDITAWLGAVSGNFSCYSNLNRFGTSNTFYAIRAQRGINVLIEGNGWVTMGEAFGASSFDEVYYRLTNYFGFNGFCGPGISYSGQSRLYSPYTQTPGTGVSQGGPDLYWGPGYTILTGNGANCTWVNRFNFPTSSYEVDWVADSGGGDMVLSTNNGSGWVTALTLDGYSATKVGRAYTWTNSTSANTMQIKVSNSAAGVNRIVALGWYDNIVNTNGVRITVMARQSTSPQQLWGGGYAVRTPIYQSWNPTLILNLFSSWNEDGYYWKITDQYQADLPNADVVLCTQLNPPGITAAENNRMHYIVAKTNNYVYFNGQEMFGSEQDCLNKGFSTAGLSGHPSAFGCITWGKLLWNFMGLTERH